MRVLSLPCALVLALIPACGGGGGSGDDTGGGDGGVPDAVPGCQPVSGTPTLGLQEVASGFDMPVFVTSPPSDPRLFVQA